MRDVADRERHDRSRGSTHSQLLFARVVRCAAALASEAS